MFAQYFEYYAIILRGAVFLWTQCILSERQSRLQVVMNVTDLKCKSSYLLDSREAQLSQKPT